MVNTADIFCELVQGDIPPITTDYIVARDNYVLVKVALLVVLQKFYNLQGDIQDAFETVLGLRSRKRVAKRCRAEWLSAIICNVHRMGSAIALYIKVSKPILHYVGPIARMRARDMHLCAIGTHIVLNTDETDILGSVMDVCRIRNLFKKDQKPYFVSVRNKAQFTESTTADTVFKAGTPYLDSVEGIPCAESDEYFLKACKDNSYIESVDADSNSTEGRNTLMLMMLLAILKHKRVSLVPVSWNLVAVIFKKMISTDPRWPEIHTAEEEGDCFTDDINHVNFCIQKHAGETIGLHVKFTKTFNSDTMLYALTPIKKHLSDVLILTANWDDQLWTWIVNHVYAFGLTDINIKDTDSVFSYILASPIAPQNLDTIDQKRRVASLIHRINCIAGVDPDLNKISLIKADPNLFKVIEQLAPLFKVEIKRENAADDKICFTKAYLWDGLNIVAHHGLEAVAVFFALLSKTDKYMLRNSLQSIVAIVSKITQGIVTPLHVQSLLEKAVYTLYTGDEENITVKIQYEEGNSECVDAIETIIGKDQTLCSGPRSMVLSGELKVQIDPSNEQCICYYLSELFNLNLGIKPTQVFCRKVPVTTVQQIARVYCGISHESPCLNAVEPTVVSEVHEHSIVTKESGGVPKPGQDEVIQEPTTTPEILNSRQSALTHPAVLEELGHDTAAEEFAATFGTSEGTTAPEETDAESHVFNKSAMASETIEHTAVLSTSSMPYSDSNLTTYPQNESLSVPSGSIQEWNNMLDLPNCFLQNQQVLLSDPEVFDEYIRTSPPLTQCEGAHPPPLPLPQSYCSSSVANLLSPEELRVLFPSGTIGTPPGNSYYHAPQQTPHSTTMHYQEQDMATGDSGLLGSVHQPPPFPLPQPWVSPPVPDLFSTPMPDLNYPTIAPPGDVSYHAPQQMPHPTTMHYQEQDMAARDSATRVLPNAYQDNVNADFAEYEYDNEKQKADPRRKKEKGNLCAGWSVFYDENHKVCGMYDITNNKFVFMNQTTSTTNQPSTRGRRPHTELAAEELCARGFVKEDFTTLGMPPPTKKRKVDNIPTTDPRFHEEPDSEGVSNTSVHRHSNADPNSNFYIDPQGLPISNTRV